jgi:hypothetical protein
MTTCDYDPDAEARRIARLNIMSACLTLENGVQGGTISIREMKAAREKINTGVNILENLSR